MEDGGSHAHMHKDPHIRKLYTDMHTSIKLRASTATQRPTDTSAGDKISLRGKNSMDYTYFIKKKKTLLS